MISIFLFLFLFLFPLLFLAERRLFSLDAFCIDYFGTPEYGSTAAYHVVL